MKNLQRVNPVSCRINHLLISYLVSRQARLKPRANGRNIVGQQLPTLLDVTCSVRLHTLLHVVGCCSAKFETSQTFQPTTPNIFFVPWSPKRGATMLHQFAQLFQHFWGRARSLRMVYKEEEEPWLIYTAQGSPFRRKKLSIVNGSPEQQRTKTTLNI